MKKSQLKQLIKEVIEELRLNEGSDGAEFVTYVEIDPKKLGKNSPIQDNIQVRVVVEGSYEDNRFDYEYGSERGTHDPGSDYVAERIEIYANRDESLHDADGNHTQNLLFRKGDKIDEESITPESLEKLNEDAVNALKKSAKDRGNF